MRHFRKAAKAALAGALGVLLSSSLAFGTPEKRVALVIGNAAYNNAPKLDNPVDDAKAISSTFKRLGFQVYEGFNLTGEQMRSTLSQFTNALEGSSAAIVFYSGHGVSIDGENYLLPIDINPKTPSDLDFNAVGASQILRQMRRQEHATVLILDACREDPFASTFTRAKSRAIVGERGLNAIEGDVARGALIAFATDPNSIAFDGPPGQHSPFTKALLNHLEDAGVPIETVMSRVRSEVWESTNNKQLPWVNTSIIGELDLNPKQPDLASTRPSAPIAVAPAPVAPAAAALPTPAPASNDRSMEVILWESAQHSNLPSDYKAYLDAFPNGYFAAMARNRIAALTPSTRDLSGQTDNSNHETGPEEGENQLNLSSADKKDLQRRLSALKFDPGPIDGEMGDKVRVAIREWQTSNRFPPTGWLNAAQYDKLKAESDVLSRQNEMASPPARDHLIAPHQSRNYTVLKRNERKPAASESARREIRAPTHAQVERAPTSTPENTQSSMFFFFSPGGYKSDGSPPKKNTPQTQAGPFPMLGDH